MGVLMQVMAVIVGDSNGLTRFSSLEYQAIMPGDPSYEGSARSAGVTLSDLICHQFGNPWFIMIIEFNEQIWNTFELKVGLEILLHLLPTISKVQPRLCYVCPSRILGRCRKASRCIYRNLSDMQCSHPNSSFKFKWPSLGLSGASVNFSAERCHQNITWPKSCLFWVVWCWSPYAGVLPSQHNASWLWLEFSCNGAGLQVSVLCAVSVKFEAVSPRCHHGHCGDRHETLRSAAGHFPGSVPWCGRLLDKFGAQIEPRVGKLFTNLIHLDTNLFHLASDIFNPAVGNPSTVEYRASTYLNSWGCVWSC